MNVDTYPRLLGDVGGTNARFAWQGHAGALLGSFAVYRCADHASLRDAIAHYLSSHALPTPQGCGIGIANPITGDVVSMTNHHWSFSISKLRRSLGVERLVVINDFTALALSLPALTEADLRQVGPGSSAPGAPLALLGPGTGLGVSGLLPAGQRDFAPINGEGGHATLAACDDREAAVVQWLRTRFDHASAERALSGPGLVNLYEAACALSGQPLKVMGPAELIAGARSGTDPCCTTALDLFCGFLGSVAGNLALTLGARGGVFIGGGIAPRMVAEIEHSSFRERFESKGRFRDYLSGIPTFVIDAAIPPALVGVARAMDRDN